MPVEIRKVTILKNGLNFRTHALNGKKGKAMADKVIKCEACEKDAIDLWWCGNYGKYKALCRKCMKQYILNDKEEYEALTKSLKDEIVVEFGEKYAETHFVRVGEE